MKRFFVMFFSVLLIAFLSSSFIDHKIALDNDVGYSLTIDQDLTVNSPAAMIGENVCITIDRGVSVPYKGLTKSEAINYENKKDFECNVYYTIDRFDLKLPILAGFENQPDKYPFASDLGLRYS